MVFFLRRLDMKIPTSFSLAVAALLPLSAVANPVINETAVLPMQIRLAYAGPNAMFVSWNTYTQLPRPTVRFGRFSRALDRTASSDVSVTYPTSTTYNNHVKITGLKPGTKYYYLPEFSNTRIPYSFTTSRVAGDQTPFTVAYVADLGLIGPDGLSTTVGVGAANPLGPHDHTTIQILEQNVPLFDFLWHSGDIAYADYWLKEEIQAYLPNTTIADGHKVYEMLLNQYYDEMMPITAYKPYMVGPGNHDSNCDNGGTTNHNTNVSYTVSICSPGQTNFTGFMHHFRMPSAESGGTGNFWYSHDHGMVHFVQFDTETDLGNGLVGPDEPNGSDVENSGPFGSYPNAQIDWLKADLASVDRKKTPWVVVAGHRPWYISAGSGDICTDCQDAFATIFQDYSVDLVLTGHFHVYERNAPILNGAADPNELNNPSGPWYISNGAAGHYDGLDPLNTPLMDYSRYAQDSAYGWSRLIFHNCTHFTQEFVASANGSVLDTATLYKERKCN